METDSQLSKEEKRKLFFYGSLAGIGIVILFVVLDVIRITMRNKA
jgi:hypothetical protein